MKTAKDTMMAIILEKMSKNVFEDVEKFSTFVSVIADDIHQLGASLIQEGIEMCDGKIIEDGLTDFDKKAAAATGSATTARASPVCAFYGSDVIAAADALAPQRAQLCASVAQLPSLTLHRSRLVAPLICLA
ncbi:hypothetical protein HPB47_015307 [Ixodes persulcatus]|uniref:Uncharacterized protein n=1 Tax=Ixodes persulcatus TaxID=34615 RepID=A0AC60QXD7_IXOPE|nr:hypothetical protein HPB47_015307 [Ixodes persulcatus]